MTFEKEIKYLVGGPKFNFEPFEPFNNDVIKFLNSFSKELANVENLKDYPDLKSLSFWCRKNNFLNMKKNYNFSYARLGVGLIFHITPANIPTNLPIR